MGAQRYQHPVSVRVESGFRSVYRFHCSKCPAFYDISANTHTGRRNAEDLRRQMLRVGWDLGDKPEKDVCVTCIQARRKHKSKTTAEVIQMPKHVQIVSQHDGPREPTRDERRIIFAKLQDVYIDEKTGYGSGWSDRKLAEDLGVPRAWVERIRDENFGPIPVSEDAVKQIEEAEKTLKDAQSLHGSMVADAAKHREMFETWHASLQSSTTKLDAEIQALAGRIARQRVLLGRE